MKKKPPKLYKYLPKRLDHIGDILVHNRVFFSSPVKFNDPFDCARGVRFPDPDNLREKDEGDWREYFLHLAQKRQGEHNETENIRDADAALLNGKHKDKAFIKDCEKSIDEAILQHGQKLGVLCLSKTPSSVSMWAHYASNHEGAVIEFDHSKFIDDRGVIRSFPVIYSTSLPTLREYLEAVRSEDPLDFSRMFFCRKSIEWKIEEEWRFFTELPEQHLNLPSGAITRVILGYRMPAETRNLVKAWVRGLDAPIQLAESVPSTDSFEMILTSMEGTHMAINDQDQYGVLLFDEAYKHLDEAIKPYVQTGPIGKYFYCSEAGPDGSFFKMTIRPEQVQNRIRETMTIWIPIQFVKFLVKGSEQKGIPGFAV